MSEEVSISQRDSGGEESGHREEWRRTEKRQRLGFSMGKFGTD